MTGKMTNSELFRLAKEEVNARGLSYRQWVKADGLTSIELDHEGCWIRTRETRGDQWSPPEPLTEK